MTDRIPALQLQGISKSFGAVRALDSVDFEAYAGEVVCLVGDNGAGKSTLIKVISGTYRADSGEYRCGGKAVTITRPRDATDLGIETVYQDLALCDNLDVVANLFLGREWLGAQASSKDDAEKRRDAPIFRTLWPLDEIAMEKKAVSVLAGLDVRLPSVRRPVATLSGGQRQSVAISRAVMWNSRVVLLDEPTAALGVAQTRQVLDLIKRLRERGLAVVLISHNLADVFEVADRIIVLRLGRRVATFQASKSSPQEVVAAITGASMGGKTTGGKTADDKTADDKTEEVQ